MSGGGGDVPRVVYRPPLFVYAADGGDGHGMRGVTDAYEVAAGRVAVALREMPPGSSGSVRGARLDMTAFPFPAYRYGAVVARAWRDEHSGALVVADGPEGEDHDMAVEGWHE
ncbi:hypothetical protein AB0K60_21670 [Thermopolyspora sp. NPDC052614]|uniref:hypothetical protein n=1 Tax=Thermopolyspora sp. NPDC052614 TaxID=3155682 RepID=UPI00341AC20F